MVVLVLVGFFKLHVLDDSYFVALPGSCEKESKNLVCIKVEMSR